MFISCDPGIANFGISVNKKTTPFTSIETVLVKNTRKLTDEEKIVEEAYNSRTPKIYAILNTIKAFLDKYKEIDTIVLEAPFYNALTPAAYGSLLEVIFAIKYTIVVPNNLKFSLIEPLLVKKLFTSKGMASKEAMRLFLNTKKDSGEILIEREISELSEHEVDAVAVGFVYALTNFVKE